MYKPSAFRKRPNQQEQQPAPAGSLTSIAEDNPPTQPPSPPSQRWSHSRPRLLPVPEHNESSSVLLVFPAASEEYIDAQDNEGGDGHSYAPFLLVQGKTTDGQWTVPVGREAFEVDNDAIRSTFSLMPPEDLQDLQAQVEHLREAFQRIDSVSHKRPRELDGKVRSSLSLSEPDDFSINHIMGHDAVCLSIGEGTDGKEVGWVHKQSGADLTGFSILPHPDKCVEDYADDEKDKAAWDIEAALQRASELSGQSIPESAFGTIASELGKFSDDISKVLTEEGSTANSAC